MLSVVYAAGFSWTAGSTRCALPSRSTLELACGTEIGRDIHSGLLIVLLDEVVDDTVVEIFTSKMSVTGGGQNLENAVVDREERNIEGSTTEDVDDDSRLAAFLVKAAGDCSSGRFVDDAENLQASDRPGVFGGLGLSVVEVCWDRDDGMGDLLHV